MKVTKKDIEKLIKSRKNDSFLNHLWNAISGNFQPQGEISKNHIKIWKQNIWFGSFYTVFIFELNDNLHLIKISDKLNSFGKFLIILIFSGFLLAIIPENFTNFNFTDNWLTVSTVVIFAIILILVFRKVYILEKQNQLNEIFEILDIETEHEIPEKEWSAKNIIIRLFTYPFCLFLIGLNFFLIIPNEQYILALGAFSFVGFYLVTDLKMIFRRKISSNNRS